MPRYRRTDGRAPDITSSFVHHPFSLSKHDVVVTDETPPEFEHRDLLSGFVRMHVLHHAAQEEIYGAWMIDELAGHGYRLSPGTLYPMLHKMVRDGYLTVRSERDGRTVRKYYAATDKGREGLALARKRVQIFARKDPADD